LRVNPHLFRHVTAKLYLDQNPGSYEVVRRVLGHRSIDTTTAFYTGLETSAAVRHFDETILHLRRGSGVG
jgi:site-specific recombinase XerD